jgi:hypothetical protein
MEQLLNMVCLLMKGRLWKNPKGVLQRREGIKIWINDNNKNSFSKLFNRTFHEIWEVILVG